MKYQQLDQATADVHADVKMGNGYPDYATMWLWLDILETVITRGATEFPHDISKSYTVQLGSLKKNFERVAMYQNAAYAQSAKE